MLRALLESMNLRASEAVNGVEALQQVTHSGKNFKVVLMDLHMPVMDGQAAFLEIRKMCSEEGVQMPAVVFCTGFAPSEILTQAINDDPRHKLLSKPVLGDVLVHEIEVRLDG